MVFTNYCHDTERPAQKYVLWHNGQQTPGETVTRAAGDTGKRGDISTLW